MPISPYIALTHAFAQVTTKALRFVSPGALQNMRLHTLVHLHENWREWGIPEWRRFLEREAREPLGLLPWLIDPQDGHEAVKHLVDHLDCCREHGAKYLLLHEAEYPDLLRHIDRPPLALTCLGNTDLLTCPKISVVGSRFAHSEALAHAFYFGERLADLAIVCVSGGAFGCDIAAHKGVLARGLGAKAIVVFAGGLAHPDPSGNRATFREIRNKGGLWLSERLWTQKARPYDFPIRNRIIAGLSHETIVIQASIRSGAMVTAQCALDQGREVLTLRLPAHLPNTDGNQKLIEDGSYSFGNPDELLQHYRFAHELCRN